MKLLLELFSMLNESADDVAERLTVKYEDELQALFNMADAKGFAPLARTKGATSPYQNDPGNPDNHDSELNARSIIRALCQNVIRPEKNVPPVIEYLLSMRKYPKSKIERFLNRIQFGLAGTPDGINWLIDMAKTGSMSISYGDGFMDGRDASDETWYMSNRVDPTKTFSSAQRQLGAVAQGDGLAPDVALKRLIRSKEYIPDFDSYIERWDEQGIVYNKKLAQQYRDMKFPE